MKKLIIILSIAMNSSYAVDTTNEKNVIEQIFNSIIESKVWNFDTPGMGDNPSPFDRFGEVLSHGDYNGDGFQDLAIGLPFHDFILSNLNNTGTVVILYGTVNGLSSNNRQFLYQTLETDPPSLENINGVEENDQFGKSLASGDFNCDGITDLAVGTPGEDVVIVGDGGIPRFDVGAINIFYGSSDGFANLGAGSTFLLQGTGTGPGSSDFSENDDQFGWSMTTGNFNGDSFNGFNCIDLAVSAPFEDFGIMNQISDGGIVNVFYGSEDGISGGNRSSLSQNGSGIDGQTESNDQFGLSLAAGYFRGSNNGVSFSDLAVGIPGEDIDGQINAGAVQVFNGASDGFDGSVVNSIWSQSGDIAGVPEANDRFGSILTSGDFDADSISDLVVTAPREDLNSDGVGDAGVVHVIYGSLGGLNTDGNQIFHQNTAGISGIAETSDRFGDSLTSSVDLNYDFYPDLVIGIPRKNGSRGAFLVLFGGPSGVTTDDSLYKTNSLESETFDKMAFSMTVADFGNGRELAVGMPGDDSSDGDFDAGSVKVFTYLDIIFRNSFEPIPDPSG